MKQHEFKSYKAYRLAQDRITNRKLNKVKLRCFAIHEVVAACFEHYGYPRGNCPTQGLCHGVRTGQELDLFQFFFGGDWIGTEICKRAADRDDRVLLQDFDQIQKGWHDNFDVIYTNSFDHSRDPRNTLETWLMSLKPTGTLYIEWTEWHDKLGTRGNFADCFAATDEEYRELFEEQAVVQSVLSVTGPDECLRKIFAIKRKPSCAKGIDQDDS
jgi:SAM-dependent methyltransferase